MANSRCKKGRPSFLEEQIVLSRILSLWHEKGDVLTFNEIHKEFVKMGIISNIKYRGNTRRILRRLIEKGYLEQVGRGKYRLKVSPKPFQVTDFINEIQEKYRDKMIYEWRVGGNLWTLVEGIIFGLPSNIEENPAYKAILGVLLIRLASIFNAIVELGITAKLVGNVKDAPVPYIALREFILNSLPHIVGERSGIDGDGLPAYELIELYKVLVKNMPKEVDGQPILIDVIKQYVGIGEKLLKSTIDVSGLIDIALLESGESEDVWRKIRELKKIILVAYPPRHILDENEDERELYELLKNSIKEGDSDATLLAYMRIYDENIVRKIINYLEPILGKKRANRLMELYKLARAGMILDSIVAAHLSFKEKKGKPKYLVYEDEFGKYTEVNEFADKTEEEVLSELRKQIDEARRHGYTLENMIKGIWLSDWSSNITPRFMHFHYPDSDDIVSFVKESIRETLRVLDIKIPRNFDSLVEEGYNLVIELDELLKKDSEKILRRLEKTVNG
ncbi:type IV toxin-antitoxin system AbiEi family antitoxin domain-containing protein [Desulfurococcaceae archaeon MEX13E-LK6-19]|nr:type IV toxin-antitoxin system AbiEi family antitoxin domain-containing protein [Desulfurococcaceae archaeon MEX13E-LK6-19]